MFIINKFKILLLVIVGLLCAGTVHAGWWSDFFNRFNPPKIEVEELIVRGSFSPWYISGTTIVPKVSTWGMTIGNTTSTNATSSWMYISDSLTVDGDTHLIDVYLTNYEITGNATTTGYQSVGTDDGEFNFTAGDLNASGDLYAAYLYGDGSNLTHIDAAHQTITGKAAENISMGQAVYVSGATGGNAQFALADNTVDGKTRVVGLAVSTQTSGQTITIRIGGQLCNWDTSAWADGNHLYLSTSGGLSTTTPTSGSIVHVGDVEYAHASQGDVLLNVRRTRDKGAPADTDLFTRFGDNAGVNKISYRDYANNEVGYINSDGGIEFVNATTTNHFAADSTFYVRDGNVGIGTGAPGAKLHVSGGDILIDNAQDIQMKRHTGSTILDILGIDGGTDILTLHVPHSNAAEGFTIKNTGEIALFSIEGTGNVGIGTTTPWARLSVEGAGSGTGKAFVVSDTNNVTRMVVQDDGNVGIGTTSPLTKFSIEGTAGQPVMNIASSTGASLLYVSESGNVGIGTAAPNANLVVAQSNSNYSDALFQNSTTGYTATDGFRIGIDNGEQGLIWHRENEFISIGTSNDEVARFHASGGFSFGDGYVATDPGVDNMIIEGNVGIGTTSPLTKLSVQGTAGQPVMNIASSTGASLLYVAESGNVGIGTAAPISKLEISGNTGLTWNSSSESYGLVTIGNASGGSLLIRTPSFDSNPIYDSGLGIDGSYDSGKSLINIKAYGVQSAGVYHSELAFHTSLGSTLYEQMRIDSNGNVGIGTTSPALKLCVNGDALADSWNVYSDIYQGDALTELAKIKPKTGETGDWAKVDHQSLPVGVLKEVPVSFDRDLWTASTTEEIICDVATTTKSYIRNSDNHKISKEEYEKLPKNEQFEHIEYIQEAMSIDALSQLNARAVVQLDERLKAVEGGKMMGGSDDTRFAALEARIIELEQNQSVILKFINWLKSLFK